MNNYNTMKRTLIKRNYIIAISVLVLGFFPYLIVKSFLPNTNILLSSMYFFFSATVGTIYWSSHNIVPYEKIFEAKEHPELATNLVKYWPMILKGLLTVWGIAGIWIGISWLYW